MIGGKAGAKVKRVCGPEVEKGKTILVVFRDDIIGIRGRSKVWPISFAVCRGGFGRGVGRS